MLSNIADKIRANESRIEAWFENRVAERHRPLFLSCDIRHSGEKIAVVDANLFPAGFNNLCSTYTDATTALLRKTLNGRFPGLKRVLLISESHTRNKFYFENVWKLSRILSEAELDVRIGMIEPEFHEPLTITLGQEAEKKITIYPIDRNTVSKHRIAWGDFDPDMILSNNDFSNPPPDYWKDLAQAIVPAPELGWHLRRKSAHFKYYTQLVSEFSAFIDVDPWTFVCRFDAAKNIDLNNAADLQQLSKRAQALFVLLKADYERREIRREPYLFLKSDSGTYGMAVSAIYSAQEIEQLNRKMRNKLLSSKGSAATTDFILQEGIPTDDFYSEQPIEPVVYLVNGRFAGGFFRLNPLRDAYSSLNSTGMQFSCLCLHKLNEPHERPFLQCSAKQDLVFVSVYLARISSLAAGLEASQ